MDAQKAAAITLERLGQHAPAARRSEEGNTTEHAIWMLNGIIAGYIQHDKAQRWLGYAQGVLVADGMITLDGCKTANKEAS